MKGTVPRAGGRAPADAPVAPAGGDLGPERVPDARLEVAPAPDLAAQLGHAAVERVDRDPPLGRPLPGGPRRARGAPGAPPSPRGASRTPRPIRARQRAPRRRPVEGS